MPLQNRVTPFGEVVAVPRRGAWMGNRGGCFHTAARTLTRRQWVSPRWIICALEFRARHREVMAPGRYTELFFLDEATALAAGHRPCRECRRSDHERFKAAWLRAKGIVQPATAVRIGGIDAVLHQERLAPGGRKRMVEAPLGSLPEGVFVSLPSNPAQALLVREDKLIRWTPGGYTGSLPRPPADQSVSVLTPRSVVAAIAAGYVPHLDGSALSPARPSLDWPTKVR